MTRDEIETRIRIVQDQLSRESHPSTIATPNRCLERLIVSIPTDKSGGFC